MEKNYQKKYFIISFCLLIVLFIGLLQINSNEHNHDMMNHDMNHDEMGMNDKREHFIAMRSSIQGKMMAKGKYRCCLEKPCIYCIEKTPGHGEGASCNCLEDIVNGVHPCGECIGEILEGHGNKYLSEYFAKAIAEKVGEEHIDTLKEIIFQKYDILPEKQVS